MSALVRALGRSATRVAAVVALGLLLVTLPVPAAGPLAHREVLPDGAVLLVAERPAIPIVVVRVSVPGGAVLVARTDSSLFVRAIPYITAIITDTGSQTSHMASVCREFKVPTVVNAVISMETLEEGRMVTLYAGDDRIAVYDGAQADLDRALAIVWCSSFV